MTRQLLTVLSVAALAGCQSYRRGAGVPAPGGGARATYATPTDLRAADARGRTLILPRVEQIEGSVVNVRGDTIVLALTRTRPSYALARPPAAPQVTLVRGPDVRLETLAFDPGRTTGRALGAAAAIGAILLLAFVVGIQAAYGG